MHCKKKRCNAAAFFRGTFNANICNNDNPSNTHRRSSHRETRCRNEVLFQRETIVKRPRKNADGFIGKKVTVFKEEMNILDVARQIATYKSQRVSDILKYNIQSI